MEIRHSISTLEDIMKSLRISALMLAIAAFSIVSIPALAQQEVAPDHFDPPQAVSTHVHGRRMQSKPAAQTHANVKVAAKHSHGDHHHQHA
jgi:hypothetical protein